uniref:Secreted peptide n=1 Tax=Ixodes ricinus TaxID=34613 RepID=A0A6B0V2Q8_IXORI
MLGTRRLLLVAYVLLLTQVLAGSADVDSAIQRASSGVGGVQPTGTTGKPVASNDTVPVPTTQSPAAGNGSNGTGAATPSSPSRGPGDAVLHFGEDHDTVDRAPKNRHYFFSSWLTWKEDNYLMSILIPIACGMSAALLILCSLACIGCCRRRCRARSRRKLHRNIDPKSIRKLKTADRIKLLAASSDEEF